MEQCMVLWPRLSKSATHASPIVAKIKSFKATVQLATTQTQLKQAQPTTIERPCSVQQKLLRQVNTFLPDDIAMAVMRLVHHIGLSEVLHSLQQVASYRAARMYTVKQQVLLNMDDDDPNIEQAREEVLYFWALANGLDISNCSELARLWPDDLEILHCLPELV